MLQKLYTKQNFERFLYLLRNLMIMRMKYDYFRGAWSLKTAHFKLKKMLSNHQIFEVLLDNNERPTR